MSVEPYNFRKPGRLASDLEQGLASWLRAYCTRAPARWNKHLPFPVEMELRQLETVRPAEGLGRLPDAIVAYRLVLAGEEIQTLLVLPRPFLLALVTAALGDAGKELPADRELTVVEDSLCGYLLQNLWLPLLQETWPGGEPLGIHVQHQETNPKWTRMFPREDNVVLCTFVCRGPFGEQPWYWMVPQKGLLDQFAQLAGPGQEQGQEEVIRPRLATLVQELPVEVTVILGAVELPLAYLAQLRAGDVLILNQRVSDPLTASVAGEKRFRVWPGRLGFQQAFQIESLIEG
jgi:flagellar motor switch protein FliM